MASVINAVSGSGITQTADGSGVLKIQSNSVTTNALAWVNFNGTTGAINASYNVSSVTVVSTAYYQVNFANALPDANYVPSCNSSTAGSQIPIPFYYVDAVASTALVAPTTSSFRFCTSNSAQNTRVAGTACFVSVFGN